MTAQLTFKGITTITDRERQVAEDQIRDLQKEIDYDLRDFTIDYIVQQFKDGLFYIPAYQRQFVWRSAHRTKFIESVILGLPIPFMFVADTDDGRLEVVDGAQRIQTLESFLNGDLALEGLLKLTALNGFKFSDLPIAQQRKLKNRALRMIVLEDKTTEAIRHEIFQRINTSGEKARPSEIRRGTYKGPFMSFITECANNELFTKLCPISPKMKLRREGEELALRFFAYSDRYRLFKHDVDKFMDDYVKQHTTSFEKARLKREFEAMLQFIQKYIPQGFAKSDTAKVTPRVRFEAIAVGVNLALRERPNLVPQSVTWLHTPEFSSHTTTHASNSKPRVVGRIEYVRDCLLRGAAR